MTGQSLTTLRIVCSKSWPIKQQVSAQTAVWKMPTLHGSTVCIAQIVQTTPKLPFDKTNQKRIKTMPTIIKYTAELDIRNVDSLPAGTGAKYVEVIRGLDGAMIAKQWRRKIPTNAKSDQMFIAFGN